MHSGTDSAVIRRHDNTPPVHRARTRRRHAHHGPVRRRLLDADIAKRYARSVAGADSVSNTSAVTGSVARTGSRAEHGDKFTVD